VLLQAALLLAACGSSVSTATPEPSPQPADLPDLRFPSDRLDVEGGALSLSGMLRTPSYPSYQAQRGEQIRFEHISIEQGLGVGSVYWITQDHLGFLWIGTSKGLIRYDGLSFKIYRHDPDDLHSLSEDHVFNVLEDQRGKLWVATYGGGLELFDRDQGQFIHYQFGQDPNSLSHNKVFVLYEDRSGVLWVGTSGGGLDRYDPEIDGFIHYRHDPNDPSSLIDDYVNVIYEDGAGVMWIGTTNGLEKFDRQTGQFIHYQHDPENPQSLSNNQVFAIVEDHLGMLWIGTSGGGLNRFDRKTGQFSHFRHDPNDPDSLSDDVVFVLLEDSTNTLWVASISGGLHRFDREKEQFVRYQNNPDDPGSLSSNSVNALFEDREGTLWIGTTRTLDKFARLKGQFKRFLDYEFVEAILEDREGSVWIGTTEGLYQLDSNLEPLVLYQNDPEDPSSLSPGWVEALYEDREGVLWVGTSSGGLNRLARQTQQFRHFVHDPNDPSSLSSDAVNAIYEDSTGVMWIGTDEGLNRFDRQQATFRLVPTDPGAPEAARVESIQAILESEPGVLWLSSWGDGLKRFEPKTGDFFSYRHDSKDPSSLKSNFVTTIYQDSANNLWVGTDGGLHRLISSEGQFELYDEEQGLPAGTSIGIIQEDQDGNLWVGTPAGLSRLNSSTGAVANYDIEHGLYGGHFASTAWRRSNGELLFGGADGVVIFDPAQIQSNPHVPPVQLVSLNHKGEAANPGQALETVTDLSLPWSQRDFEFQFAALSYVQPERNQHAYMLEGYDQGWNYIGTNRTGRYTNLPGGTYTLRVKGSNNDGVWNEEGTSLHITIVPPVWATWWFRGLVVLGLVAGAVGGYRLRVHSVEARARELEHQVQARTRELATLNVVTQTVSQSLKLDAMLTAALDKVLEVLDFESGAIYLRNPTTDQLEMVCHRGLSARFRRAAAKGIISAWAAQSGNAVIIDDTAREADVPQEVIEEGLRSVASIPLVSRGDVQGVLSAASRQVRRFGREDLNLLLSIGRQIGVAIENARLYEGTKNRLAQITALQETSMAMASTLELDELLNLITQQATALLRAEGGILNLVDWEKREDEAVACAGVTISGVGYRASLEDGLSGWIALHNQPVISHQTHVDDRVHRNGLEKLEAEAKRGIQNAAGAPLTIKDQVVGSLVVVDKQGGEAEFDQNDLDLLVAFGNQAAMAIENARLFKAEQRRAEQFRVISEVGRQLTSILDIDEVLAQIVRLIQQTFDYDHVGIALVQGEYVVYKVGAGVLWDNASFEFEPSRLRIGKEGITGWVAGTGEPMLVPDVSQEPRYIWMQGSQTRSELTVPLKVKGEIIGVLDVQNNRLNAFDESDLAMLQSLANQAAVAIKNAQLFDAEQRRAEQFRVISEVGRHVTSILTIDELLKQMATLIRDTFDYYHVGFGLVEGDEVISKAEVGALEEAYQDVRLRVGQEGIWGWVASTGEPLLVPDTSQEPRFHLVHGVEEVRSHVCVPLKTKDAVIGVLSAGSNQLNAFDDSDLAVLQSLADQAAIAIENAHLYERAQQVAVVEERSRLARDLHDAVTQTLFSSSLIAEALPELWASDQDEGRQLLKELRQLSRGALAEMRTLLLELRPAALAEANLKDLLRQLGEAVTGRSGVPVSVSVELDCALPPDVHVALYRIAQEALNNVVKHANARQVRVTLGCTYEKGTLAPGRVIELCIDDDGRGFDLDDIPPDRLGLHIIHERAQAIGASLKITSQMGHGTRVVATWKEEET
jgi:GAF domain-containing protein/ligand-binding sensor domain-containing protein/two-component sensor histidine kinase